MQFVDDVWHFLMTRPEECGLFRIMLLKDIPAAMAHTERISNNERSTLAIINPLPHFNRPGFYVRKTVPVANLI